MFRFSESDCGGLRPKLGLFRIGKEKLGSGAAKLAGNKALGLAKNAEPGLESVENDCRSVTY